MPHSNVFAYVICRNNINKRNFYYILVRSPTLFIDKIGQNILSLDAEAHNTVLYVLL